MLGRFLLHLRGMNKGSRRLPFFYKMAEMEISMVFIPRTEERASSNFLMVRASPFRTMHSRQLS